MSYARLKQQLEIPNQTHRFALVKKFLAASQNRQEIGGEELDFLVSRLIKLDPRQTGTLFLTIKDLRDKFLTKTLKACLLQSPLAFIQASKTHAFREDSIKDLLSSLSNDEYIDILPHLTHCQTYQEDFKDTKPYPLTLKPVVERLARQFGETFKADAFGKIPYQTIKNQDYFKTLFKFIAENTALRDDLYQHLHEEQYMGLVVKHGALLDTNQLKSLLAVDDKQKGQFVRAAFKVHGYAITIVNWPKPLLDILLKDVVALADREDKIKSLIQLFIYAGDFRRDKKTWYQANLPTLLETLTTKDLIHAATHTQLFDTYWHLKPAFVKALMVDEKIKALLNEDAPNDNDIDRFIGHLFKHVAASDIQTLSTFPRVKAYLKEHDLLRALLPIVQLKPQRIHELISDHQVRQYIFQTPTDSDNTLSHDDYHPIRQLLIYADSGDIDLLMSLPRVKAYFQKHDILDCLLKRDKTALNKKASLLSESILSVFDEVRDASQNMAAFKTKIGKVGFNYLEIQALSNDANLKALLETKEKKKITSEALKPILISIGTAHGELKSLLSKPAIRSCISGHALQTTKLSQTQMTALLEHESIEGAFLKAKQQSLVQEIFNKKWDRNGIGLFHRKTPTNIKRMRRELGGKLDRITYPLDTAIYERLIEIADTASQQSPGCFCNTRHPKVQAFYNKVGDDKRESKLTFS